MGINVVMKTLLRSIPVTTANLVYMASYGNRKKLGLLAPP
jgi:hypothetical protein